MIFWPAGVALGLVWLVFRDPAFDYRMVVVGALLPDLLDAPFGGARLAHTLLAAELAAREAAAADVPADLAALYEQLRARLDGVAAAPLVNGRCGGCHLALPATEVARLRKEPPETLVRCEQCERILVRP